MSQDPSGVFGGVLRGCIAEEKLQDNRRFAKEGVAFFVLGIVTSAITTYFLFQLGLIV